MLVGDNEKEKEKEEIEKENRGKKIEENKENLPTTPT